ncbi:MAG TPA: hypothetical protein VF609_13670 [Flavisolibacter sp.]|jgi:hypothetical protein
MKKLIGTAAAISRNVTEAVFGCALSLTAAITNAFQAIRNNEPYSSKENGLIFRLI